MANRIQSRQEVLYEINKEDLEVDLVSLVETLTGEVLPFVPNKITVDYSDPENGIYQIRVEYNDDLPQVMPLREDRPQDSTLEPEVPTP